MNPRIGFLIAGIWVVLVAGQAAAADREAAEFFADRGEKALKEKNWGKAEEAFRRALKEDESFLPARYGLAEALLGAGRRAEAVEALRRVVHDAEKSGSIPVWPALLEKAKKRLQSLDLAGATLDKIIDGYVKDLLALARKWLRKDPDLAGRCLRRILRLRPGQEDALKLQKKLGGAGTGKGKPLVLFNGRDLSGWVHMGFPTWQVREGMIIADVRDAAYTGRSEPHFKRNFEVRLEMKVLEERPGPTMVALLGTYKGDYNHYALGLLKGRIVWEEQTGEQERRSIFTANPTDLKKGFDPAAWNTFTLQFREKEVLALVNGARIAREPRPSTRDEGFVGLLVQNAKVAFRKIEVLQP
ncbi:MAG: family 16 glycoside hydrolase [Planctomycetota bacterium]|jgi:tetratricopeptide (TPR) repeat protein